MLQRSLRRRSEPHTKAPPAKWPGATRLTSSPSGQCLFISLAAPSRSHRQTFLLKTLLKRGFADLFSPQKPSICLFIWWHVRARVCAAECGLFRRGRWEPRPDQTRGPGLPHWELEASARPTSREHPDQSTPDCPRPSPHHPA